MMNLFTRAARLVSLVTAAALIVGLTACGGDGGEGPETPRPAGDMTPTVTAEAVSTPEATPTTVTELTPSETAGMDDFRAFAPLIQEALAEGDTPFFADRGVEEEMVCAGDEELGPCVDQLAGTVLTGIPSAVAQSDDLALFTPDDYAAMLMEWSASGTPDVRDKYGDGGVTLYALAHRPADEDGDEAYQAIVTGIFQPGITPLRQARILSFQFLDGSWWLTRELFATIPFTTEPYLSGECSDCYDRWERWEGEP